MEEYQSKTIKVYGDKFAREKNRVPAYERVVHAREVTFVCAQCGKRVTEYRLPGRTPRYCSEACSKEAKREQTRERVKRFRQQQHKPGM